MMRKGAKVKFVKRDMCYGIDIEEGERGSKSSRCEGGMCLGNDNGGVGWS